ncbi:hypothetical protein [Amycolatopsis sp. NPDC006125]|uniref:hypothetical protein n=1 Tax=Amycolatopsis sp. NPDC006125 TaxID=3156730 RepID=UPI0033B2B42D
MNETQQHALPLWSGGDISAYRPMFAVDERVGYRGDPAWRGRVVQVAFDKASNRNHFWVIWTIGQPGGPHVYTAGSLCRAPELTAAERRRERQGEWLTSGLHPLTAALGWPLRLHPDAPPAADHNAPGPRCGTCLFRELLKHHDNTYAKCAAGNGARRTHGPGTDIRAWWPACIDHQEWNS